LATHKHRLINDDYYQKEQVFSLGSGAIESGIKQIGKRKMRTFLLFYLYVVPILGFAAKSFSWG